jgi:hypothetical protein
MKSPYRNLARLSSAVLPAAIFFGMICALPHGIAREEPFREFQDQQGNSVEGQIQNVSKNEVMLKLRDGRTVPAKLDLLRPEDVAHVQQWLVVNKLGRGDFFKVKASRLKSTLKRDTSSNIDVEISEAGYEITVRNNAYMTLHNLRVEYLIFKKDDAFGKDSADINRVPSKGQNVIEVLPLYEETSFITDSIKLEKRQLDAGWDFTDGSKHKMEDRLGGIWLRIYSGDLMIAEYSDPTFLMKREKWK